MGPATRYRQLLAVEQDAADACGAAEPAQPRLRR